MNRRHLPSLHHAAGSRPERGSIIIIALVLLMMVTLIGTSATNTATIEIQVAGNERNYKQNFYQAETAAMRAMSQLETLSPSVLKTNNGGAIKGETFLHSASDTTPFQTKANWQAVSGTDTYFLQINRGTDDLDMTAPTRVYEFAIYGMAEENSATKSIIQVGYKRRY